MKVLTRGRMKENWRGSADRNLLLAICTLLRWPHCQCIAFACFNQSFFAFTVGKFTTCQCTVSFEHPPPKQKEHTFALISRILDHFKRKWTYWEGNLLGRNIFWMGKRKLSKLLLWIGAKRQDIGLGFVSPIGFQSSRGIRSLREMIARSSAWWNPKQSSTVTNRGKIAISSYELELCTLSSLFGFSCLAADKLQSTCLGFMVVDRQKEHP